MVSDLKLVIAELRFGNGDAPSFRTVEKKNGVRIGARLAYATGEVGWSEGEGWPKLSTIGAVRRESENVKSGEKNDEWSYYISGAKLAPEEIPARVRFEWNIESMHWLLDVHFAEDGTHMWDMKVQRRLMEYSIKFRPNKPGSPHLNGKVERSPKTDLEEFYPTVDLGSGSLENLLSQWQHYYNWFRPHSSLGSRSPEERRPELSSATPF